MILVDERVGSKELLDGLRALGCDAELGGRLAADFQFDGCGPNKTNRLIGVERKTVGDLAQSIRTRRFEGQQLQPMVESYDTCYLIVEGIWRRGRGTGLVEVPRGRGEWATVRGAFRYAEAGHFLARLEEFAGIRVRRSADQEETCAVLVDLYTEWAQPWEERRRKISRVYAPVPDLPNRKKTGRPHLFRHRWTLKEKWAAQLTGVDDRAADIAKKFRSARDLANATVEDWLKLKGSGLRIGRKTAERIVQEIESRL